MQKTNKLMLSLLILCSVKAYAMNTQKTQFNTYKGQLVNDKTIVGIAEKNFPLSKNLKIKIDEWIQEKNHAPLLGQLTYMSYPLMTFKSMMQLNSVALQTNGLKNLGNTGNYVFEVPGADSLIKIGGLPNRVNTLIKSTGTDPYDREGLKKLNINEIKYVPTYQTISRMAYFLSMQNAFAEVEDNCIVIPKTHLLHVPGRGTLVCDDNYVVLQEKVPGLQQLNLNDLAKMKDLDLQKTLAGLYTLAQTGVFWNIKEDALCKDNKGNIIPLDFEQPNNSDPRQFFNNDDSRRAHLASDGVRRLQDMINKSGNDQLLMQWIKVKNGKEK